MSLFPEDTAPAGTPKPEPRRLHGVHHRASAGVEGMAHTAGQAAGGARVGGSDLAPRLRQNHPSPPTPIPRDDQRY